MESSKSSSNPKARQKEESASVLDQPAPMGRDGETYRQFADRMAESGARLDSRDGKNTIMYGDFGDFSVPQEVADYFTSVKNGQAESAQKSDAQGGEQQANETDRGENIAPEEKAAQNGSNEAREENEENNGREKSAQNKKAADDGGKNNPRRNARGEWVTSKGDRIEIADGYRTESGRSLDDADRDEFIIKPDGGKDFGEIPQDVSDAVKEQSGENLRPGAIRLKAGDEKQGLVHAKEHEKQAIDAGYSSIEEMIGDVAQNFDRIYKRNPKTENGQPSYTLVKTGDKRTGTMNATSPIYFELRDDGQGGYYLVITAIPKGDRSLSSQTKKDHLIYRSPAVGAAAISSDGAVYASPGKEAGAEGAGLPTSENHGLSFAQSISQEQTESKKEKEPLAMDLTKLGGDENASAFDTFKWTIERQAGRDAFTRTMNREMNYNGVKETRREHIERIFREHPEWEAAQMIRKPGTKDMYGLKQTDYMIYHGENVGKDYKKYPFEYITQAEKKYLDFLHGFEPLVTNNAYAPNENLESFADVVKEGQKRDAEIDDYIASHPEAKDMPRYKVEEKIKKEREQSAPTEKNEKQEDFHGFLSSKDAKVASEADVRSYLSKQMEVWDDATQSRKKITMAEYIENFTKTPGAEFFVKMPDNNGLAGQAPLLVYQNEEMKKRNYAPTLDPVGFAYGRYLLQNQSEAGKATQEQSAKNTEEKQESAAPASNTTQKENVWGDESAIMDEMDAMLGKRRKSKGKKANTTVESVNNKLFNDAAKYDDQADEILKALQKELSKLSANPMLNPKVYELGLKYGLIVARRGARKFSNWAQEMTDKIGEAIRPWLKSIWQGIMSLPKNQAFDEKRMRNFVQFVGTQHQKGNTTFEAVQDAFIDEYGDKAFRDNEEYMEAAYEAVNAYYNPETVMLELEEVSDNELSSDLGDAGRPARSGEGANQDVVGRPDETGGPREGVSGTGRQIGESGSASVGESGVRGGSATARGEAGNRGVQSKEPGLRDNRAGNTELSGSVVDSYEGHSASALERGAEDPSAIAPEERREHESDTLKQNTETTKAGPREKSIERDLPMLLPEQRGDVVFCENRLLKNGGAGVMLTNGTGTGKTYSGLGLAKRFYDDGKKNILIITKESGVIQQWKKAATDSFGMDAHILESTKDAGKGVTITTYANLGVNDALLSRDWDLVIADESQLLMSNEKGDSTKALDKVRALTYHNRGLNQRFRSLHAKEYEKLDAIQEKLRKSPNATLEQLADDIRKKLEPLRKEAIAKWKAMDKADKPRMLFLSATPFSRENNADYVEGYLFDYPEVERGGYNSPSGRDQFMIEHFGYRMRYGKLTKPDAAVDNGVMERQFNEWLKKIGAVSGRTLSIDKDYDRGFLLTPNNEGKAIDAGFDSLQNKKYEHLREYINANFGRKKKHYLLEYLKAKESVPIIKEYLKAGKKVVVFHQSMKEQEVLNPFIVDTSKIPNTGDGVRENIIREYRMFRQEHPELYSLGLENLQSPIETLRNAFGDKAVFYNGAVSKKKRSADKDAFNDDNSGKDIIVVQQDAGNAGVSLHDVTGKHQRVLLQLSIPTRPVYAIQIEGRIFRVGVKTNAIFRYLTTGTDMEKSLFASEVASRSSTAENLSLGNQARALRDSFINLYMETMDGSWERRKPGHTEEGTGGKEMDNAGKNTISEWDMAKSYYYAQQKKTSRNKAAEGQDYYATPEPIGYKMVEWAQAKDGDRMLEPSAGHGAISRWFSPNTKNTIIEPSDKLSPLAEMVTENAQPIHSTFENHNIVNKYDAIVMNPPFGTGGKTAVDHLAKAFRHLKDGGRVIAILPDGPSAQKHFDKWFYGNPDAKTKADRGGEPEGVFMKEVLLPGVAFERAGTKVNTRIVVIDKFASEDDRIKATGEAQETVDLRDAKDINELFDRMENLTAPDRGRGNWSAPRAMPAASGGNESGAGRQQNEGGESAPSSESNFTTGEHTHTKTGEKIPMAKLKERIDDYKAVQAIAKRHGGGYSRFAKKFLFKTEESRDAFVRDADELLNGQKAQDVSKLSMDWVLRHHINAASRYVAMETEFKPKAISLFERMFGDFNKEHTGVAQYTKEYINDVNGVPSALEDAINRTLNSNLFWRRFVASRFGDRAALHLANSTTGAVSIMKLGMGNISSALLNFTQLANTAAYLGDARVLYRALQKGAKQKYTDLEKRVLEETNVTYDIGLDSGGGYDRFKPGKLAELSMWPFKKSEEIVRRGTVLAAYEKAIKDGKTHKQAIRYAEEINRKANFDYSVADAPNIFRRGSIFSQLLLQFKKYPIKELEVMSDMLPVFSNKTNAKQKAIFWGTYFLLAGLFQIPFGDWLEDLAELAGIKPGPTMRKWIMQAAGDSPTGKMLGRMAMYGIGAGVNVDISRRFGLGDVLPSDVSLDSVGGATFSTAKNTAQLIGNVMHGDTGSALANLRGISPGVANIVSAAMGRSYGKRGRLLSEYDSMYDRILKAMGFRSADEAVASDIQSLYYDEKKDRAEEKQRAIDDFLRDGSVENARRLKELGVRPDTVKKERQRKKQNRLSRIEGAMTKQERREYQDLLKFGR